MFSRLSGILAGGFSAPQKGSQRIGADYSKNRRLEVSSRLCYC